MKRKIIATYILSLVFMISSCENNDLSFSLTPAIGFAESAQQVRAADSDEIEIFLSLNAPLESTASVNINVIGINGFVYGVDYVTMPAATGGLISLDLAAGSTEGMVKYIGMTQSVIESKAVLFQLESGTNITIGQPVTQDFTLTMTTTMPLTISHNFEDCTEEFSVPPGS